MKIENKRVLDPCCGSRMFWFDKNNPDAVFCDVRTVDNEVIWRSKDGTQERRLTIAPDMICDNCPLDNIASARIESGSDIISRADAIEAVVCHIWHMPNEVYRQFNCENIVREVVEDAIKRIPSAETLQNLTKPNKTYEDDIIRRQDAIEAVKQAIYNHDSAIMRITSLPSASVEVVRCGECRHKYMKDFDMFCPHMVGIIKPNMHCSYGEREGE